MRGLLSMVLLREHRLVRTGAADRHAELPLTFEGHRWNWS
ncbi:hypothetical protein HDA40_007649 [Hamadaea flava]|nr:hypothetical protein [Hamadaea flava]